MQKRYCYTILLFFIAGISFSQSNAIPGFRYEEDATIHIRETYTLDATIEFAVYDDSKIIIYNGKSVGYSAEDVIEFYLKQSKKQFLSVEATSHRAPQFVEDLTPDQKKVKIVKSFTAYNPFTKMEGIVKGKWSYHFLFIREDKSRPRIVSFEKITEFIKNDCPELSQKIISQQEGYFIDAQTDPDKELDIYKRIASEIERCKP